MGEGVLLYSSQWHGVHLYHGDINQESQFRRTHNRQADNALYAGLGYVDRHYV